MIYFFLINMNIHMIYKMYILHISNAYNTPAPEEAHVHIYQRQMRLFL